MYNTVIFDLDGTLLNTIEDLTDSTNYALAYFNYPLRTIEEVTSFVGNGVGVLIYKALPIDDKTKYEECLQIFKTYYETHNMVKTKPYDDILKLIKELYKMNIKMAIVSNKFQLAVEEICKPLFYPYISIMLGEEPHIKKKPYPDMVNEAIKRLNTTKENTIYVGDSEVDYATSKNSEIAFIGVSWGFRGRKFLEDLSPLYIVDKPLDIISIIK